MVSSLLQLLSHSVIASYWPGFGDSIENIDPAMKRIGSLLFFLKHSITLTDGVCDTKIEKTHLFCRIQWKQYHTHPMYFGSSAIACTRVSEVEGACCFLPLKRIANRCAFGDITTDFGAPRGMDTAFVAIPLPFVNIHVNTHQSASS